MSFAHRLLAGSVLAASLLGGLPVTAASPSCDPVFFENALPSGLDANGVKVTSFRDGIMLLAQISGKKIVLPEGIANWLNERPEKNWNASASLPKDGKTGPLFNELCQMLGVVWRYDSKKDDIFLDFKWQRDDVRTTRELAGVLLNQKPVEWTDLPRAASGGFDGFALDGWRRAFDALLSKPENFSACSRLRLYHDSHSSWAGIGCTPVDNLFAGKLQDDLGHNEIIVLNKQRRMCDKDCPGDVAYFLFDENGRFLRGGIYAMAQGFDGDVINAKVDYDGHVTIAVGWGSSAINPDYVHFALKQGDLVLEGSTTSHGTFKDADQTRAMTANDVTGGLGLLKFSITREKPQPSVVELL